MDHPTGTPRYRMAATAHDGQYTFIGGSINPYNYNGIGYNGKPSEPDTDIWTFNLQNQKWQIINNPVPSMDHRGLIELSARAGNKVERSLIILGGMESNQRVTNRVFIHTTK